MSAAPQMGAFWKSYLDENNFTDNLVLRRCIDDNPILAEINPNNVYKTFGTSFYQNTKVAILQMKS